MTNNPLNCHKSAALIILSSLILVGCGSGSTRPDGPRPVDPPPRTAEQADEQDREDAPSVLWRFDAPRNAQQVSSAPVKTLIRQATIERDAELNDRAVATLQRAARIEPRNAFVWGLLSKLNLEMDRPREASALARKSNSLAQTNPFVQLRNWRVIAEAEDIVDDDDDADEAEEKVEQLEDLLGDFDEDEWWLD